MSTWGPRCSRVDCGSEHDLKRAGRHNVCERCREDFVALMEDDGPLPRTEMLQRLDDFLRTPIGISAEDLFD